MRNLHRLGLAFIILLFLFVSESHGQCPGSSTSSPIYVGTLGSGSSYSDGKDNGNAYCFSNRMGQPSSDIFYQFTLSTSAQVNISHCGSGFDTYLHLLDANGNEIAYNDDNGPVCSGLTASISQALSPGIYYVVSEGYGGNTGYITTQISVAGGSSGCNTGEMWTCNGTVMYNTSGGNVGIGTNDTKGYKFAVNGSAIFTSVNVKTYNNWPDYVFTSSYKLRPLSYIEKFIKQYNRLPELPSAEDVKNNGFNLEENQAVLLKKVEELTLYMIEQNKKQEELNHKLKLQNKRIEELQLILQKSKKGKHKK